MRSETDRKTLRAVRICALGGVFLSSMLLWGVFSSLARQTFRALRAITERNICRRIDWTGRAWIRCLCQWRRRNMAINTVLSYSLESTNSCQRCACSSLTIIPRKTKEQRKNFCVNTIILYTKLPGRAPLLFILEFSWNSVITKSRGFTEWVIAEESSRDH